jgi:hypothetical protein
MVGTPSPNNSTMTAENDQVTRSVSEYLKIVFQKHNGLGATWNQTTTCSPKSGYSDTLLGSLLYLSKAEGSGSVVDFQPTPKRAIRSTN